MLNKNPDILSEATYQLIRELQACPELDGFYLVGGTALTLQLGHRNSIDIDLITRKEFDSFQLMEDLKGKFPIAEKYRGKSTFIGFISDMKVDFIRHDYPILRPLVHEDGITMLSMEDIAAMKLNAIANSAKRLKDFIDIYYLLEHFSIKDMVVFFERKYFNISPIVALRAVSYFGDIDENIDPPKLLKPLSRKEITTRILDAAVHSSKTY